MTDPSLRWLLDRPPARDATSAYLAGRDAPAAVLSAMVAEGLLVAVAGGLHLPADLAAVPQVRAAALAQVVPAGAVASTRTALWVRGLVADCGGVLEVLVPPGTAGGSRLRPSWLRVRGAVVAPADVELLGVLPVTGLTRTASDLARWAVGGDAVGLVAVTITAGCDPAQALAHLGSVPRQAGVRRAREVLRRAAALASVPLPRQPVDVEDAVHAPHRGEDVVQVRGVGHLEGEARDRHAVA